MAIARSRLRPNPALRVCGKLVEVLIASLVEPAESGCAFSREALSRANHSTGAGVDRALLETAAFLDAAATVVSPPTPRAGLTAAPDEPPVDPPSLPPPREPPIRPPMPPELGLRLLAAGAGATTLDVPADASPQRLLMKAFALYGRGALSVSEYQMDIAAALTINTASHATRATNTKEVQPGAKSCG